jgi:hypothetical protein
MFAHAHLIFFDGADYTSADIAVSEYSFLLDDSRKRTSYLFLHATHWTTQLACRIDSRNYQTVCSTIHGLIVPLPVHTDMGLVPVG